MSEKLLVVAAIPNYNMADSLAELLPQVLEQGYDEVYVLDDASTDHSRETTAVFDGDVRFVAGSENIGPGGTRSRILDVLSHDAIIHFMDADMRLESERTPEIAREIMRAPDIGFIGGLIKRPDGLQSLWNYGPRQCLHTDLISTLHAALGDIGDRDPARGAALRERFAGLLKEWPNPYEPPEARRTFWVREGSMLIRSDTFRAVGGYDRRIRNHEVQDLSLSLHEAGLRREFNPLVSAIHTAVQVRNGNRSTRRTKAEFQIARKHGLLNWLLPDGHFKPEN